MSGDNTSHDLLEAGEHIVLGVGDFAATNEPDKNLKTYGLGSCVAVIILYPQTRTAGMAHIALPDSSVNSRRAFSKPAYFADTGLPALFDEMSALGCRMNGREIMVKLAGGARIMDANNVFDIGKRNVLAIKKWLLKHGMVPVAEDVGGHISRTVTIEMNGGWVRVDTPGYKPKLL